MFCLSVYLFFVAVAIEVRLPEKSKLHSSHSGCVQKSNGRRAEMLDINQKNLKTKRIIAADTSKAWQYVTLSPKFHPARYKASLDTGLTTVACVTRDVRKAIDGGSGRQDVFHFRAANAAELRDIIERDKVFGGTAVFSVANPEMDLKAQHAQDVKAQKAAAQKEREDFEFVGKVTAAHRQMASEMNPQQLAEAVAINLQSFINDESLVWYEWFRRPENRGFLSFPNGEKRNRATLLAICNHRGQILPLLGELDAALRYGLANHHFFLQNTYKRSETDAFHAVVPYAGDVANPRVSFTHSDAEIHAASQKLRKALPAGQVPSEERLQATAKELGISSTLLDAVMGRTGSLLEADDARGQVRGHRRGSANGNPKYDVSNLSSAELKRGLAALRPPVDPNRRRQGY
jgi:hypothetical protein